jgi:hypothetical protein
MKFNKKVPEALGCADYESMEITLLMIQVSFKDAERH